MRPAVDARRHTRGLRRPEPSSSKACAADDAGEQATQCGREHDPEHGATVLDECHIDREFAIARDELARAVERIDQPEAIRKRGHPACAHGLFGDDRHIRREARELGLDQRLGAGVGLGHRRGVMLGCDLERRRIDLHDDRTGGAGDRDHPVEAFEFR